ncbi:condensation domain-containing protein [Actinokineospora soli]|uniref:Condensation domain-containing protein n=1 Tax=Actinokineospora soli TaxID=1048753 RepID=A0ABW2TQN5_9PSEU
MNPGSTPTRPDAFPASAAQQRLWFLQHRHPDSRAYTVTEAIWLRGPLDASALERALTALVDRHPLLRAVFDYRDGGLWQRVLPAGAHPVALRRERVDRADLDAWLGSRPRRAST